MRLVGPIKPDGARIRIAREERIERLERQSGGIPVTRSHVRADAQTRSPRRRLEAIARFGRECPGSYRRASKAAPLKQHVVIQVEPSACAVPLYADRVTQFRPQPCT